MQRCSRLVYASAEASSPVPATPAGAQQQQQRMPPSRRELLAQPEYPRNTPGAVSVQERPAAATNNDRAGRIPVVVSAPLVRELEAALAASPWGYTPHLPPELPVLLPYGEADAGPALEDVVRRYPADGGDALLLKSREREVEPADAETRARVAAAVCAVVDYAATRAAPGTLDHPQACVLCLEAMASTKRSSEHFWARYMTEGRLHPVGAAQALQVYIHLFDASVFPEVDMRLVDKLSSETNRPWQPIQLAYLIPVARAVARFRGLDADWADTLANAVDAQVRSPTVLGKALSQLAATPAIVSDRPRASLARAAARHAAHVARDQLQPLVCNLADCGVPLEPPTRNKLAARAAETADAWPHAQRARMLESLVRLRIPVAPAQIEQTVVAALESLLVAGRTRDVLVVVLSLSELAAACDHDNSAAVDTAIVDALTAILPQLTSVEVIELAVRNAARPLKPLSALLAPQIEDAAPQLTSAQAAAAIYALVKGAATDVTRNDDAPTPLSDALVATCNRVAEQMTPADVARAYAGVAQIAPSQADHLLQLLRARVVLLDAESVAVAWTSIHALREWEAYTYRDLAAQTRVLLEPATFRTIQHASPHAVSTTLVAFASLRRSARSQRAGRGGGARAAGRGAAGPHRRCRDVAGARQMQSARVAGAAQAAVLRLRAHERRHDAWRVRDCGALRAASAGDAGRIAPDLAGHRTRAAAAHARTRPRQRLLRPRRRDVPHHRHPSGDRAADRGGGPRARSATRRRDPRRQRAFHHIQRRRDLSDAGSADQARGGAGRGHAQGGVREPVRDFADHGAGHGVENAGLVRAAAPAADGHAARNLHARHRERAA